MMMKCLAWPIVAFTIFRPILQASFCSPHDSPRHMHAAALQMPWPVFLIGHSYYWPRLLARSASSHDSITYMGATLTYGQCVPPSRLGALPSAAASRA